VGCGLAVKLTYADESARYDGRTDPHHHARCLACGASRTSPARFRPARSTRCAAARTGSPSRDTAWSSRATARTASPTGDALRRSPDSQPVDDAARTPWRLLQHTMDASGRHGRRSGNSPRCRDREPSQESPSASPLSRSSIAAGDGVRREGWRAATWGVSVVSLDSGDTLFAIEPDAPLSPASNLKLLTTAAALEMLGPEYRFRTYLLTERRRRRRRAPRRPRPLRDRRPGDLRPLLPAEGRGLPPPHR
jgi:hypothetical protein